MIQHKSNLFLLFFALLFITSFNILASDEEDLFHLTIPTSTSAYDRLPPAPPPSPVRRSNPCERFTRILKGMGKPFFIVGSATVLTLASVFLINNQIDKTGHKMVEELTVTANLAAIGNAVNTVKSISPQLDNYKPFADCLIQCKGTAALCLQRCIEK